MRIALFENIMTPGGHEVDFDRIIVEELSALGHEVSFYVPEGFVFSFDYHVPVHSLPGEVVTYTGVHGLVKMWRSVKREFNRKKWYKALYQAATQGEFDAIVVPTSTYRYLRSLAGNVLQSTPVPIVFILHGINPKEKGAFFREAKKLLDYPNVKLMVLTFGDNILGDRLKNMYPSLPPAYTARDIPIATPQDKDGMLKLGFFGQYRREKNLEDFLDAYISGHFTRDVVLLVQGSTMHQEDAEDFERIIRKYSGDKRISFLHAPLIGADWQRALMDMDVLVMPYSSPRYRYHWGGMLFNAIGYKKPVITSDDMNPEVFKKYEIGVRFKSGNMESLRSSMETLVNTFDDRREIYRAALERASETFSPRNFALKLAAIMGNDANG